MIDCREMQRFSHAYLDGEFIGEEHASFAAHLYTCERCRLEVEREQSFRQRLKECDRLAVTVPTGLRRNVLKALDKSEPRASRWNQWAMRLVPAAVAMTLVVGALFSKTQVFDHSEANLNPLFEQSIQWHRRQLPLDVPSPRHDLIRQYFTDKLPFAVRPPQFADPRVKLVGARLTNLREHPAAYLVYQIGDERVSVFVLGDEVLPLMRGHQPVQVHVAHGYTVAMVTLGSTAYAVASEMDQRRMAQLVSSLK